MACEKPLAVVTGGAQGLGYAIVTELLSIDYQVCILDVNETIASNAVGTLQKKFGEDRVSFHLCDVTQKKQFTDVFELILKKHNKVDILINNAGILDEDKAEKMVQINLMGVINGCDIAFKYMNKDKQPNGGIVINTGSISGLMPTPIAPIYCATKHAVTGLTRCYGDKFYFESSGITFCALCPHALKTVLWDNFAASCSKTDKEKLLRQNPAEMEAPYVAKAAIKLIQDKKNGSCLLVTNNGYKYISPSDPKDLL